MKREEDNWWRVFESFGSFGNALIIDETLLYCCVIIGSEYLYSFVVPMICVLCIELVYRIFSPANFSSSFLFSLPNTSAAVKR